ncbi:RND superfamily putative drug exporter [Arthrobacter stackebrandtii]|uniref:RND superfamily putative drug exporter n=1 Tax=Arthrobacter stackebrandtii TaxID=272161 RepID=A0ABS4YU40_9MICC|nr:MMPL family transporter [Arthrobacter stackebrandtii]MBP2411463.1 RND superfamily putative drug exporter [Arthrobacter stackebrandtii]PYH00258.1 RND transporter [Arthrobacter stackebrandtii]
MALWLYRLGRFSARRAWLVIAAWAIIMGLVGGAAALFMGPMSNDFKLPGTETQQMADKLQAGIPEASGGSGTVVFSTTDGTKFTPAQETAISAALKDVTSVPGVTGVVDPFATTKTITDANAAVTAGQAELDANKAKLDAAKTTLDASAQQIEAGQAQIDAGKAELEKQKAQAAQIPAGTPMADAAAAQLAAAQAQIDASQAQLDQGKAQLAAGQKQYDDGQAQLTAGQEKLTNSKRMLEATSGIKFVSNNGEAAIAQVQFKDAMNAVTPETRQEVQDVLNKASDSGLKVSFSKEITEDVSQIFGAAEVVGVAVAAAVLLIMLGTFVAAGLPLLMAVVGVGIGVGGTMALTSVIEMSSISPMLALMLGLAVGIDYSLFIVNRHRQQMLDGMDVRESIARASGTSGNAVTFAGLTVVIALAALSVTGLPFLAVLGLAAAATVAVSVLVALTLTPALLSLIGTRLVSKKAWARNAEAQKKHDAETAGMSVTERAAADEEKDVAKSRKGWGGFVTKHSVVTLIVSVVALVVIAIPAASLRLALPDGGSEPVDSSAYQAYTLTSENFGAGMTGPIMVVASLPAGLSEEQANTLNLDVLDTLREVPNVVAAAPVAMSPDRQTALYQIIPSEGPASESTVQVVHDLRDEGPKVKSEYDVTIGLTGQTAANVDVSEKLGAALPPYLAIVVGLSLILLILVFRSILVPVLATAGFLLSLVAAFGGVVAVYQWGWLGGIFDVANPGAVLSFLPIILIGVLFGLAMDYQVFIASGMREAYAHGQSAKQAVRTGFKHAAPVVTAAAIIMISVFSGFIFSHLTMVRPLGFALAFGVLIDAFVVRMTIVPAAMHLLGKSAWWLPKWLDKILPDVDVEGAKLANLTVPDDASELDEKAKSAL